MPAGSWAVLRDRLLAWLTLLLAFLLPIGGQFVPPVVVALFVVWITDPRWGERWHHLLERRILLPAIALYLLYVFGLFYAENLGSGVSQLETKLGLLALPLIYGTVHWPALLTRRRLIFAFVAGCAAAVLICTGQAMYQYWLEHHLVAEGKLRAAFIDLDHFFASRLSFLMHPSYLAMQLCLATWFLFTELFEKNKRSRTIALLALCVVFSGFIFLLTSRLGFITLLLLWFGLVAYFILRKKMYWQGLLLLGALIAGVILLYRSSEIIASRFDYAIRSFTAPQVDKASEESSALRRLIWSVSADVIGDNWLTGVGTGDVDDELTRRYTEEGMTGAMSKRLNAHNQFLQTFMAIGIAGFTALALMLLLALVHAVRRRQRDSIIFLLLFLLNALAESMFERQTGVLFFAFFFSVLPWLPINSQTK